MKRSLCRGLVLFLLVSFEVYAQEQANAPNYQQGECWIFNAVSKNFLGSISDALQDGAHEICYDAGSFFKVGQGEKYKVSGVWVGLLHIKSSDGRKWLDNFPLIVGKQWSMDYVTVVRGTNRREKRTAETRVVAVEDVLTTFGTVRAFKIDRNLWWYGHPSGKYTYYWSPQTKSVVKYNYEAQIGSSATREIELIKFKG